MVLLVESKLNWNWNFEKKHHLASTLFDAGRQEEREGARRAARDNTGEHDRACRTNAGDVSGSWVGIGERQIPRGGARRRGEPRLAVLRGDRHRVCMHITPARSVWVCDCGR